MEQKTTQQPKRGSTKPKVSEERLSLQQKLKHGVIYVLKKTVTYALFRPAVWHWLMVNIPSAIESAEKIIKFALDLINPFD